ncbi:hypothetical protein THAOC_33096 [Thalassiosira oceanica]|uniref:Uncharacterized protein n=1 Tax=Thalassiosira oceanica TaxID=159749 RepID=K0R4Q1_THAOC|nr:hypothetical protein THAOC_33096 [Thalassiosira oceanica]|eukprot:EJK48138.1 hypothetical protein THAOC_33096 [Thalassiosira oceanica]
MRDLSYGCPQFGALSCPGLPAWTPWGEDPNPLLWFLGTLPIGRNDPVHLRPFAKVHIPRYLSTKISASPRVDQAALCAVRQ